MRNRRRGAATVLLTIALGIGVAACSSDDDGGNATKDDTSSGASGEPGTEIVIRDFAFEPETLAAKVGDTITVTNDDDTDHTVTADDGPFDTGDIAGDGTTTLELTEAGVVPYHCDIHNYMTGTIRVTE